VSPAQPPTPAAAMMAAGDATATPDGHARLFVTNTPPSATTPPTGAPIGPSAHHHAPAVRRTRTRTANKTKAPSAHSHPTIPTVLIRPAKHLGLAGCFHYHQFVDGRAHILPTWLVTGCTHQTAQRLVMLLGGQARTDNDDNDDNDGGEGSESSEVRTCGVLTNTATVEILLDSPSAIHVAMVRRHGHSILRACNGHTQTTPTGPRPCQCPPTLAGRWQAAKQGRGCEPLIHVTFRLAQAPALGRFVLASATWTFADHAAVSTQIKAELRRHQRPVHARLGLDRAIHTTRNGTTFAFTRPTITILRRP